MEEVGEVDGVEKAGNGAIKLLFGVVIDDALGVLGFRGGVRHILRI